MRYEGRIYRPPSEARSVLIQLTVGCSHNRCAFCAMYIDKRYRVRPPAEVLEDVDAAARVYPNTRRVFICDGDALSAGFQTFASLCEHINKRFPKLERIAAYVNARDILRCSPEELLRLRQLQFSLAYLGLESGSAQVLELIRKGATPEDMVAMAQTARAAGIALSAIVLLGAGGGELSEAHARETVTVVNAMQPKYLSFLTAMIVPHTPLMTWARQGRFAPMTDRGILLEARQMLAGLELKDTLFRMNHISNLVALAGRLPADKADLLHQLDRLLPFAQEKVTCLCSEAEGLML